MDMIQFPERFSGRWIFLNRLRGKSAVSVLMRREVFLQAESGREYLLFITANSFYQLFINGSLVGAGPRVHQNLGTSYIDVHDVGINLLPGKNVIAVQVCWSPDERRADPDLCPGMWCQLQSGSRTLLQSDENWLVMSPEDNAWTLPGSGAHCFVSNLMQIPENWTLPEFQCGSQWQKPDVIAMPGDEGGVMELHPLTPGEINLEAAQFKKVCSGNVEKMPVFSSVVFPGSFNGRDGAAVSYIFSDNACKVPVRIYAETPLKFFCGHTLLVDGSPDAGQEIELVLEKGWTRLVIFVPSVKRDTAVMLWANEWPGELIPLNDMLEASQQGWCTAPLQKVHFEECTFAVNVESLPGLTPGTSDFGTIAFVWDFLEQSQIVRVPDKEWLAAGETELWELPEYHYGFVNAEFTAHEGDVIDMLIGTENSSGTLLPADIKHRNIVSCICREGKNELRGIVPVDCSCVLIWVRHARGSVTLRQITFEELTYEFESGNEFRCSDPLFNDFWQAGAAALKRSSSVLCPTDGNVANDSYLLDSFWEAVNIAAVYGDAGYCTLKLRQFAGTQLENGALTALSGGKDYDPAFFHMFFFPGWIIFNFRFTRNMVEMRSLISRLDGVKHYLVSLLDNKKGILDTSLIPPPGENEKDAVVRCRLPVVMNALFCRFMMSASEVYEQVERVSEARECRRLLRKVSAAVIENFYDSDTSMFADNPITPDCHEDFSLLGNFFPLLAGMKTEECFERFVKTFFDFQKAEPLTVEAYSPYFHWLFCEMLFALGQREWGTRYLRTYWEKRMVPEKGVWKSPTGPGMCLSRFAGGDVIVPNVFLIREILGIRVAEPGHSVIYFDPAVSIVQSAEGVIPTALGRIRIKWEKQADDGWEIDIFSTHPVKVLPEIPEELLKKSTFRLGEHVTLVRSAVK